MWAYSREQKTAKYRLENRSGGVSSNSEAMVAAAASACWAARASLLDRERRRVAGGEHVVEARHAPESVGFDEAFAVLRESTWGWAHQSRRRGDAIDREPSVGRPEVQPAWTA